MRVFDHFTQRAKVAVAIPYKYGHSDVGDVFVRLMRGEYTEEEATEEIELLILTYKEYQRGYSEGQTIMRVSSVMRRLRLFEEAVREHEVRGAYPPEDAEQLEENYKNQRELMENAIKSLSKENKT